MIMEKLYMKKLRIRAKVLKGYFPKTQLKSTKIHQMLKNQNFYLYQVPRKLLANTTEVTKFSGISFELIHRTDKIRNLICFLK